MCVCVICVTDVFVRTIEPPREILGVSSERPTSPKVSHFLTYVILYPSAISQNI